MNDTSDRLSAGDPLVTRRRWKISVVWLVPAVAALIGLSMLAHAWLGAGSEITITFSAASGLDAGKTPVKYRDVTIGTVSAITLSEDGAHVIVRVSLDKSAENLARKDSRFWIVRPRIGVGGISGVDTLFSGAFIGVDRGVSSEPEKTFTGLETPPTVIGGTPGKSFVVRADDMGSLDIGSPVYYRRIQVGRVASYQLAEDGQAVALKVFIEAPYDRFVTAESRFWNASGLDVSLGADGLKLRTQSVAAIIAGGIAFSAAHDSTGQPAAEGAGFILAKDQDTAMAAPDGPSQNFQLRFDQPLRGLAVGAPVQFSGRDIGRVVSVELDYDPDSRRFPTVVDIVVFPQRLGRVLDKLLVPAGVADQQAAQFMGDLVRHGLRAQARSGNLLTGQLYIALDFVPDTPEVAFDASARPLRLPTVSGGFDQLQEQVTSIVAKIEKMPLESIGQHLDTLLAGLGKTLETVNDQVLPETTQTLRRTRQTIGSMQGMLTEDAPLRQDLSQMLQEVLRTARSVRVVTDLLGRHPEALLFGRPADQ